MKILSAETFKNSKGVLVSLVHIDSSEGYDVWFFIHIADEYIIVNDMDVLTEPGGMTSDDEMMDAAYLERMEKQFFKDLNTDSYEDLARFMADQFEVQE